jgi:hypothetical protein
MFESVEIGYQCHPMAFAYSVSIIAQHEVQSLGLVVIAEDARG